MLSLQTQNTCIPLYNVGPTSSTLVQHCTKCYTNVLYCWDCATILTLHGGCDTPSRGASCSRDVTYFRYPPRGRRHPSQWSAAPLKQTSDYLQCGEQYRVSCLALPPQSGSWPANQNQK